MLSSLSGVPCRSRKGDRCYLISTPPARSLTGAHSRVDPGQPLGRQIVDQVAKREELQMYDHSFLGQGRRPDHLRGHQRHRDGALGHQGEGAGASEREPAGPDALVAPGPWQEGGADPVIPKITQEALAEMIGTTRARVSGFMNKFRTLGLIDYNGGLRVSRGPPERSLARLSPEGLRAGILGPRHHHCPRSFCQLVRPLCSILNSRTVFPFVTQGSPVHRGALEIRPGGWCLPSTAST
jgi:hypothetical protein